MEGFVYSSLFYSIPLSAYIKEVAGVLSVEGGDNMLRTKTPQAGDRSQPFCRYFASNWREYPLFLKPGRIYQQALEVYCSCVCNTICAGVSSFSKSVLNLSIFILRNSI
jgi:hypothetical protein